MKVLAFLLILFPSMALADWLELREFRGNVCYDGDTCYVTAKTLPTELQKMSIRILGIDTPEIRGDCDKEKALAVQGKELANSLFRAAKTIEFKNLDWDKYGGRILADVYLDGELYSKKLIDAGLARPYFGDKKQSWCE
jgi:endonuclease YncB( thermonuclease family)